MRVGVSRRSRLRWRPTRRDAIFLRVVILVRDLWIPRGATDLTFIVGLPVDSSALKPPNHYMNGWKLTRHPRYSGCDPFNYLRYKDLPQVRRL